MDNEKSSVVGIKHYYANFEDRTNTILNILKEISILSQRPQVLIFFLDTASLLNFYRETMKRRDLFALEGVQIEATGPNPLRIWYVHGELGACKNANHNHTLDCQDSSIRRVRMLRNREIEIMFSTDQLARGIDIRAITLVINFDEPNNYKTKKPDSNAYIQKVGRTGRYSDIGVALTFVKSQDFVKHVEAEKDIKFQKFRNAKDIVGEAAKCADHNLAQA